MNAPNSMTRREALKTLGAGAAVAGLSGLPLSAAESAPAKQPGLSQPFVLPTLDYSYDALEPHIDARTMEIHLTKHHKAYVDNANKALLDQPALQKLSAEEILRNLAAVPETVRTTLRNNVGGHVNHTFFWKLMGPKAGGAPSGELATAINSTFGSFDGFKTQFADAAAKRFGSGWAWLIRKQGALAITSTANQDSPLSEGATPVLGLDVWEHAYYLKYQNLRADYVKAFWNVLRWDQAAANYAAAKA